MALNGTEILILSALLKRLAPSPRVLALGYPDLLVRRSFFERYMPGIDLRRVPNRADSETVAIAHNFPNDGILESKALVAALGARLVVIDIAETILRRRVNLNEPVSFWRRGKYDLIIDPGTIEHCFNVAQAMKNVVTMLKVGGFVYHQAAMLFCNHGFYSLSPTFFVDFYASNGFSIAQPYRWGDDAMMDHDGIVKPFHAMDHRREYPLLGGSPIIGAYVARKDRSRQIVWPIQYKYGNRASSNVAFADWLNEPLHLAGAASLSN